MIRGDIKCDANKFYSHYKVIPHIVKNQLNDKEKTPIFRYRFDMGYKANDGRLGKVISCITNRFLSYIIDDIT